MRQMVEWPNASKEQVSEARHVIDLCVASQKFLLPLNGEMFVDEEFRALDETLPLRLPHAFSALEFAVDKDGGINKAVVFCREGDGVIYLKSVLHEQATGSWYTCRDFALPTLGYIDRATGAFRVMFQHDGELMEVEETLAKTVLGMLNALACSNVNIQSHPQPKLKAKLKGLPFDDYHILTIEVPGGKACDGTGVGGSHRSPREHLRRGHIRRYETGIKVWVNATVVNPGIGGKVSKDYRVKA